MLTVVVTAVLFRIGLYKNAQQIPSLSLWLRFRQAVMLALNRRLLQSRCSVEGY